MNIVIVVLNWNQRDASGATVPAGRYYLELEDVDSQGNPLPNELISFTTKETFMGKSGDVILAQATTNASARFEREQAGFTYYTRYPGDPAPLGDDVVLALHEDSAGAIWVGTWKGGLRRITPRTGRTERFRHDADDAEWLVHDLRAAGARGRTEGR